ncbi:UDP-N-acetylglucosamine 4,6-dehydratase (inverting) [Planctomycetota bacterium]
MTSATLDGKSILVTGGSGSFGQRFVATVLERSEPKRLIIFSRDELKQFEMAQRFSPADHRCLRYFIGDVRDLDRLWEAFLHVDIVVHAAALKQVPTAEYNPFEAIQTNVLGAQNVIRAAIRQKVSSVIALSTDKAANPVNLYGATKLCSDKLFVAAGSMSGVDGTRFAAVRYGNVVGSRGSVIPFFVGRRDSGVLPITDKRMTRFSITLQEGVDFVLQSLESMLGGEIFVPKLPSYRIMDVARAIAPEAEYKFVGIRPGEKVHETLVPADESWHSVEFDDHFVIAPMRSWRRREPEFMSRGGRVCESGFSYTSDNNTSWLSLENIRALVQGIEATVKP